MKKKIINKIFTAVLLSSLIMTQVSDCIVYAEEEAQSEASAEETQTEKLETLSEDEKEVVRISSVEDLIAFAGKCGNDRWSVNKRVELENDISLEGVDFEPIQIFAGTFCGNGHTITGLNYEEGGYADGFFRYIATTGIVQDLNISGVIKSSEDVQCTGGLCGVNGGWILNCTFGGKIEGRAEVGGIAGENESTGTINRCSVRGTITGYDRVGGITGANYGTIRNCRSNVGVNSDSSWLEEKDDEGLEWLLEDISERKLVSGTDVGGIAGYSKGSISNCTNSGVVGYEHNGYNIGGIAGRQAGQVSLCTNDGNVYGRKDVGGIVGQMEPYISVEEAGSTSEAVQRLHDIVDKFIDDISDTRDTVDADLDTLKIYSDATLDDADVISGQATNFVDDNIDEINRTMDNLDYLMDRMPYVIDDTRDAGDKLKAAVDDLEKLIKALKSIGTVSDGEYDETEHARLSLVSGVGGNVYSDKAFPAENEEVTITVTPEEGYKLKNLTAVDAGKNAVELREASGAAEGSYAYVFTMPAENVVVKAEFAAIMTETSQSASVKQNDRFVKMVAVSETTEVSGISGETETPSSPELLSSPEARETAENSEDGQDSADSGAVGNAEALEGEKTTDASESSGAPDKEDDQETPGTPETPDAPGTQETENTDVKIILESNAGGKADYTLSDNTVTLTVKPDFGYTVDGTPTALDGSGNKLTVSSKGADSYVYTLSVAGAVSPVKIMITFKPGTDSGTAGSYQSDLSKNVALLETHLQNISDIVAQINKIMAGKSYNDYTAEDITAILTCVVKLAGELSTTVGVLSDVISDLTALSYIMTPEIEAALKKAGVELNNLTKDLDDAMSYMDSALGMIRSIVVTLNGRDDIQFEKMGDDMKNTIQSLFDDLDRISSYAGKINDDLDAHSEILEEDLRGINDQINEVYQLFVEKLEGVEDLYYDESVYEDVSDEYIGASSDGKVDKSTNSGIVKGDINVGGIAGSMAIDEEDPEGNAAGSVDYSLGSRYLTKCIVYECVNDGKITAKKNGVGGIAGYMNLGIVADSEAYGSVESTEGEYVGGVSGESLALIKDCWALTSLEGSEYVGGIVGSGSKVEGCYAIALIDGDAERKGAIVGWLDAEEDERLDYGEDIKGNYFVSSSLGGIDGVSYIGAAEPISYDELLEAEGVPVRYRHLQLTFIADDKLVNRIEVEYGTPLSEIEFPEPPPVDDTYGEWPDVTDMTMDGNITLEAEYYDNITTLPSIQTFMAKGADGKELERPYAYIDGVYTGSAVLNVSVKEDGARETKDDIGKGAESVIYALDVENGGLSGDSVSKARIYNPYENVMRVMENVDGEWREIEYKEYGGYIQVDMTGESGEYRIISNEAGKLFIYVIAGAAALLIIVVIILKKSGRGK